MSNFLVGLTGGIASGKTTIANEFAKLGAGIVDADIIAREVVAAGTPALAQIAEHFGTGILLASGELNRAKLRDLIFDTNSKNNLNWLNALLHPLIRQNLIAQAKTNPAPYCLLVVPLLFENGWQDLCDCTLAIDVDVKTQIKRLCERDKISKKQASAIINSQLDRKTRIKKANFLINNRDIAQIKNDEILRLHTFFLQSQ